MIIHEPFIAKPFQLINLVLFIELCVVKCPEIRGIKLVTRLNESEPGSDQREGLKQLTVNLKRHGIALLIEYCAVVHERCIV